MASLRIPGIPTGQLDRIKVDITSNTQSEAEQVLDNQADAFDAGDTLPPSLLPGERRAVLLPLADWARDYQLLSLPARVLARVRDVVGLSVTLSPTPRVYAKTTAARRSGPLEEVRRWLEFADAGSLRRGAPSRFSRRGRARGPRSLGEGHDAVAR